MNAKETIPSAAECLTGDQVRALMRRHKVTIAALAAKMGIPRSRVRHVRERGVSGKAFCLDWLQAIEVHDAEAPCAEPPCGTVKSPDGSRGVHPN